MERSRWAFDELAHAGREHLDADYAAAYDRKAQGELAAEEDLKLLRDLGLNERSTLVDLGAGTGTVALTVARYCRRVVAVDVSSAMLDVLTTRAAQLGVENIECVQAGFLNYEHRGSTADFVYSRNALHHLPDFWKALALDRVAALLKPDGILRLRDLVFAFDPSEANRAIEAWLASAPERPDEGWTRSELEEHLREEHSTFSWLLEAMLTRAGFEIREASYGSAKIHAAYVCVKRRSLAE
jgi:ubiquinone/menaquinone biosynthesis C-methylase UbiE